MNAETRGLLLGAALGAGLAATAYAYDQIRKRLPKYRQQAALLHEVRSCLFSRFSWSGWITVMHVVASPISLQQRILWRAKHVDRSGTYHGARASNTTFVTRRCYQIQRLKVPNNCLNVLQYEELLLPPRAAMEALEDDMLHQVG
jgi:hypothetical protein